MFGMRRVLLACCTSVHTCLHGNTEYIKALHLSQGDIKWISGIRKPDSNGTYRRVLEANNKSYMLKSLHIIII